MPTRKKRTRGRMRASAQRADGPAIAEAVTPEIQALADGLENDPVQIYQLRP